MIRFPCAQMLPESPTAQDAIPSSSTWSQYQTLLLLLGLIPRLPHSIMGYQNWVEPCVKVQGGGLECNMARLPFWNCSSTAWRLCNASALWLASSWALASCRKASSLWAANTCSCSRRFSSCCWLCSLWRGWRVTWRRERRREGEKEEGERWWGSGGWEERRSYWRVGLI